MINNGAAKKVLDDFDQRVREMETSLRKNQPSIKYKQPTQQGKKVVRSQPP